MYTDVLISKSVFRWRTAVILRELEDEVLSMIAFAPEQAQLSELMAQKEQLESGYFQARLALQRKRAKYDPRPRQSARALEEELAALRQKLQALDENIAPLAVAAGKLSNARWGLLMRAGNDKSHLARQVERYADIYTSRVSNFLYQTPFAYLRPPRGSLPHDPDHPVSGAEEDVP